MKYFQQDEKWIPSSLNTLGPEELGGWLDQVLLDGMGIKGQAPGPTPVAFLRSVFYEVRGDTRLSLQRLLADRVEQLAADSPTWRGPAALQLLRAAARLTFDDHRERIIDELRTIADAPERFALGEVNRHLAALQTLLDLRYEPWRPEFWLRFLELGMSDPRYATTALEGAARFGPSVLVEAIKGRQEPFVDGALRYLLPSLLTNGEMATGLAHLAAAFPEEFRAAPRSFITRDELPDDRFESVPYRTAAALHAARRRGIEAGDYRAAERGFVALATPGETEP